MRDVQNGVGAFTATNIETYNVRTAANKTVDLANASGYSELLVSAPDNQATYVNISASEGATFTVENNTGGNNVNFDFTNKDLSGDSDAVTAKLSGTTSGFTLSIDDPETTGQLETLNIDSAGDNSAAVSLADDALTAKNINISGKGDLDISGTALATEATVSAAKLSGDLTVDLGTAKHTLTGGSGDDVIVESSSGDLTSADTVDGGDGSDTLTLKAASGTFLNGTSGGNVENVSNIETLRLATTITGTSSVDMSAIAGLKDLVVADYDDRALTVTNLVNNAEVELEGNTAAGTSALTLGLADNTSSDQLTLKLDGGGFAVGNLDSGNAFAENLIIDSVGTGANTIADMSDFDAKTVTITGDQDIDLDNNVLSTSVSTINAAAATGDVKVKVDDTSAEITGGSGDDTLTGKGGADVIDGGDGKDTIDGKGGNDTIDAGAGDDTVLLSAGNDDIDGGEGNDTLEVNANSDFSSGSPTSNVISLADGSVTVNGTDYGTTLSNIQNIDASGQDTAADDLTLVGNDEDNILTAGEGADTLTGGEGNDTFVTDDLTNITTISDFASGDSINVDTAVATHGATNGFSNFDDDLETATFDSAADGVVETVDFSGSNRGSDDVDLSTSGNVLLLLDDGPNTGFASLAAIDTRLDGQSIDADGTDFVENSEVLFVYLDDTGADAGIKIAVYEVDDGGFNDASADSTELMSIDVTGGLTVEEVANSIDFV